jgi:hypothetical protein
MHYANEGDSNQWKHDRSPRGRVKLRIGEKMEPTKYSS